VSTLNVYQHVRLADIERADPIALTPLERADPIELTPLGEETSRVDTSTTWPMESTIDMGKEPSDVPQRDHTADTTGVPIQPITRTDTIKWNSNRGQMGTSRSRPPGNCSPGAH